MAESPLENVKRTLECRREHIKKGITTEGARGYQYNEVNIIEELNELSKIKNMDHSSSVNITQVGIVNIRRRGAKVTSKTINEIKLDNRNTTFTLCKVKGYSNINRVTYIPIGLAQSIKNSYGISTKNTSLIKNDFTIIPMTIEVNKEYIFNMNDLVFLKLGFKTSPGRGAYHIYTEGLADTSGILYNLKGKTLNSDHGSGKGQNFDMIVELGYNKRYQLNISAKNTTKKKVKVYVYENVDRKKLVDGGSWIPKKMKNNPYGKGGYEINKITYLTTEQAVSLYIITEEDIYLKLLDGTYKFITYEAISYALDGAPKVLKELVEKISKIKFTKHLSNLFAATAIFELPSLIDIKRDLIKKASNSFNNGVKAISQTLLYNGYNVITTFEPWTSDIAEGESRFIGGFRDDISILWR